MLRFLLSFVITLVSIVTLNTGPVNASPQGKKIAFLIVAQQHAFIATLSKTFVERANSFGMEVTVLNSPFDAALQSQQVDDAIARKFDIIAIIAAAETAMVPALTRARSAKMPVVLVNSPLQAGTEDLYVTFVGEDHVELGRVTAGGVLQALKEGGRETAKIALITGSLQEGVGPRRVSGFREVIAKHPKLEIVATEDVKWDTVASERVAGQFFARFAPRGGLDVVYGMADNQAVAIIRAAEAANIPLGVQKGSLVVVGSNCLPQGIAMIKAGKQYSTGTQLPTRTGNRSAEMVADYFNGKTLPKHEILPVELVTRANVEKWRKPAHSKRCAKGASANLIWVSKACCRS